MDRIVFRRLSSAVHLSPPTVARESSIFDTRRSRVINLDEPCFDHYSSTQLNI
jgi:hypothetical protein